MAYKVQFLEDWGDFNEGEKTDMGKESAKGLESKGTAVILREELDREDVEDLESKEKKPEPESKGPMWQKKYGLTKTTNIGVVVWPPGQYDSPTIQLTRGEQDEEGNWSNRNINIPIGKCIELAERMKQAAWIVRDYGEEEEE